MILELKSSVPVRFACRHFGVSPSSYYAWVKGTRPARFKTKKTICDKIKELFKTSKDTYGSPRIYEELRDLGIQVSENTVAKYMREMGLDARLKKKFRFQTTDSNHSGPIAPRLFKVEDEHALPMRPGELLAGDITYLRLGSGFLYLGPVRKQSLPELYEEQKGDPQYVEKRQLLRQRLCGVVVQFS